MSKVRKIFLKSSKFYTHISHIFQSVYGDKNITIDHTGYVKETEKPIGMIPLDAVVIGGSGSGNNTSWSSEPDLDDGYSAVMKPLIADYKKSITDATGKAAGYVMEGALMAAPMPGLNILTKTLGGAVKFAANKTPFRSLVNIPSVGPGLVFLKMLNSVVCIHSALIESASFFAGLFLEWSGDGQIRMK